jgi:hypothetical protein
MFERLQYSFCIVHVFNVLKTETRLNYVLNFICAPQITIYISVIHTGRSITFRGTIIIYYGNHRYIVKTSRCPNSGLSMLQQVVRIFTTVFHASESLSSKKEVRRPNGGLLHCRNFCQRPQLISRLTASGHKLPHPHTPPPTMEDLSDRRPLLSNY